MANNDKLIINLKMAKIKQLWEWTDSDMCLSVHKADVSIHFPHATLFNDNL